jgi:hypothetical protein
MGARSTGSHPTTTKADGHLLEYFRQNFGSGGGGTNPPPAAPQTGITATGGIIGGYVDGSAIYRTHVFTSSGVFNVTAHGDFGSNIDVLIIASILRGSSDGGFGPGGFGFARRGLSRTGGIPGAKALKDILDAAGKTKPRVTKGFRGAPGAGRVSVVKSIRYCFSSSKAFC